MHKMGEMKSARITSRRILCTKIERESHETIQRLASRMQEMQEQMNSMNDSGEFQEVESNHSGRLCYHPSQPAAIPSSRSMLSREKRLPLDTWNTSGLQENFCGNKFSTVDSSRNPYQRIHHSMTPGDTGSVPVHIGTRTLVARYEDLNRGSIPMPTFGRRQSTISSLFPVDIPQNSMVGQQRYRNCNSINSYTFYIRMWEDTIQKPSDYLFRFSIGGHVMDQRSRDGRFTG